MAELQCDCGANLEFPKSATLVACPSCEALHNVSKATKNKTAYLRCSCDTVLGYPIAAPRVKCPSCEEVHDLDTEAAVQRVAKGRVTRESRVKTAEVADAGESDSESAEDASSEEDEAPPESVADEDEYSEDESSSEFEPVVIAPKPKRKTRGGTPGGSTPKGGKKKTKGKKKKKVVEEKRLARWRGACPSSVEDRIARARTQRMFMIEATTVNEITREYAVLGSTGNVYTVTISLKPRCTCPDHMKGNICKHILLVYLKVLKQKPHSPYIYQKALLSTELAEIYAKAPPTLIGVLANEATRRAYAQITGKEFKEEEGSKGKQRPLEGDCPVCMEEFEDADPKDVDFCKECGNNIHKICLKQWIKGCRNKGNEVTCVYCRAEWPVGGSDGAGGKKRNFDSSYVNLASEAGVSARRDTSSYSGWYNYHQRRNYGGWGSRRRRWY